MWSQSMMSADCQRLSARQKAAAAHMQLARTLIGAKVPGTCSAEKIIAPRPAHQTTTSINQSAVSEGRRLPCNFCACQPRLGSVYVAATARWRLASTPAKKGRPRDPFAQSLWTPRDPNPTTPPARMRQVTILAGADPAGASTRLSAVPCRTVLENPRDLYPQGRRAAASHGPADKGVSPCLPASLEIPVL